MTISTQQLNRATLARQLLLRREPLGVVDAVRRLVGLQAQHAASPYLALWNRVAPFDPVDLDGAFAQRALVKATLMRITLHVVDVRDHSVLHAAMQPTLRAARLGDARFTSTGLSVAEADALLPQLLELTRRPRTSAEVEAWLDGRLAVPAKGVWWALRSFAPLLHAPTGGPWSFGARPSYIAAGARPAPVDDDVTENALRTLVLRYLEAFGPASVADVSQFALVRRPRVREAVARMAGAVETVRGPDGAELFDVPGSPRPAADTPAPPRLLPMWDNVLLAYADRSRVVPPDYRKLVTRVNGDVLPTLLVDGYVAGVWRPVEEGIEATAFHPLSDEAWEGLAVEARALVAFLADREPRVYRRYDRWWTALPRAETRVLPAA